MDVVQLTHALQSLRPAPGPRLPRGNSSEAIVLPLLDEPGECIFCLSTTDDDDCPTTHVPPSPIACTCVFDAHASCWLKWVAMRGNPAVLLRCPLCFREVREGAKMPWRIAEVLETLGGTRSSPPPPTPLRFNVADRLAALDHPPCSCTCMCTERGAWATGVVLLVLVLLVLNLCLSRA